MIEVAQKVWINLDLFGETLIQCCGRFVDRKMMEKGKGHSGLRWP
jgi:hypothetical protein